MSAAMEGSLAVEGTFGVACHADDPAVELADR